MGFEQMQSYFGFGHLPFDRRIAPGALYRSGAHQEARARIQFLISQGALGLICGEVGAGKTCAARAAVAGLDHSRHTIIYLANPAVGTRGIYCQIVQALGGEPCHYKANLIGQACELLQRERTERAKQVVLLIDLCRGRDYAEDREHCCGRSRRRGRSRSRGRTACRHSFGRVTMGVPSMAPASILRSLFLGRRLRESHMAS